MRPIALSLTAFQSFGEKVELEFTHLEKNGVFVISGETGSGKTTILDSMCWALFGELPGDRGGVAATPRSNNANPATPTRVVFVFECSQGGRYRVVREPAQLVPKKRGEGFTNASAKATLERHVANTWEAIEEGPKDVNKRVAELIGLTLDEFTTVVLLPQGLVAKALSDKTNARGQLLRTLFGTEVYQRMTTNLEARAAEISRSLGSERGKIDALYNSILEHANNALQQDIVNALPAHSVPSYNTTNTEPAVALVFLSSLVATASAYAQHAASELQHATEQFNELSAVVAQWNRREQLTAEHEQLNARAPHIAQQRSRIELAERAAQCRSVAAEAEKHNGELTAAEAELALSETSIAHTLSTIHATNAPLASSIAATSTPVELVKIEAQLATLATSHLRVEELASSQRTAQMQLQQAASQREALITTAASASTRRASITEQLPALTATIEHATGAPERQQALRDTLGIATAAHKASLERQALEAKRTEAAAHLATAEQAFARVNNAYHSGIASALAAQLADGELCPVCGSHEHPQKAAHVVGDTSRAELDSAQLALSQAQQVLNTIEANIVTQKDIEATGAGLPSVSELTSQVAEIAQHIASATAASNTLNALREELHQLDLSDSNTASQLTACDTAEARYTEELTAATTQRAELEHTITTAIGTAQLPQFTALVAQFSAMVADVSTLRQRVANMRSTQLTLSTALASVIANQKFASEQEFRAALLTEQQLAQLEAEVAQFNTDLQGVSLELEQLQAKSLPVDKPDTTALHAKVTEANQQRTRADQGEGALRTRLEQANYAMEQAEVLSKALESAEAKAEVVRTVATAVKGLPGKNSAPGLEAWILRSILDDVVMHANIWLEELSGHKYQMVSGVHVGAQQGFNELSISILDRRNGEMREVSSLSGGEKFQAALAFSLGLGGAVTSSKGSVSLPCLFVDEGFGTLDPASREKAVAQLNSLRGDGNGRVVGVITHVEEIKQMLVSGIEISGPPGARSVRQPMLAESGIGNTWKADLSPAG